MDSFPRICRCLAVWIALLIPATAAATAAEDTPSTKIHDVLFGIAIGLGLWLVYSIYSILHVRSCAEIQKLALQPIPPLGDNASITIWGFQKEGEYPAFADGVCDGSPYVARVELYLRLLKQPYTKRTSTDLSENPRSKLPFANVYGKMVDDSAKIIDTINDAFDLGNPLEILSKDQQMQAHFVRRLLTGSLYWVRYQMQFGTEIGRQAVKHELAENVPLVARPLVNAMVIKSQTANLFGQGTGRMPLYEVIEHGEADLRALAALLRKSKTRYILSTLKPTVVDTDVYAFVSHLFYDTTPSEMDWILAIQDELPLLVQYVEHMRELLFPELKLKSS
jgi:glutathione S-transferase